MALQNVYEKDGVRVIVNNKYIYLSTIYKIWSNGASLLDENYYSSSKPIKLLKREKVKIEKDYRICRFMELRFAPESYLIKNSFKLITNEN